MKKIIIALSIVIILSFAAFAAAKYLFKTHNTSKEEISFDDIKVLMGQYEPTDGVYTDFVLRVGNTYIPFQGRLLAHRSPPQIYFTDITNDDHKDVIVIFQSDAGTGCYGEDIHIFDGVTLDECSIEFLPETINSYAKASTNNGTHTITIVGKEYTINTDELTGYDRTEAEHLYIDKQYYAYEVGDETLKIFLACGIWKYGHCGYIEVSFEHKGSSFVFNSALFVPNGKVLP